MKKILPALIVVFIIAMPQFAMGQGGSAMVKGKITDTNGQALENVNISLKNYPLGTTSMGNGEYHFTIPARKEFILVVSSIGYLSQEKVVNAKVNQTIILNFTMEVDEYEIGEVDVTGNKRKSSPMVRIDPKEINQLPMLGLVVLKPS